MGRAPEEWLMRLTLSTPGLHWEGGTGLESAAIRERLFALDGTYSLKVKTAGGGDNPNDMVIKGKAVRMSCSISHAWLTLQFGCDHRPVAEAIFTILNQASELQYYHSLEHPRAVSKHEVLLQVRGIRTLDAGHVHVGWTMPKVAALAANLYIQRLSMQINGSLSDDRAASYSSDDEAGPSEDKRKPVMPAFLDAIEHNMCVTSTCPTGRCSPFARPQQCTPAGVSCPAGDVAIYRRLLPGDERDDFTELFQEWYYSARIVAVARRNAELERRVHTAVLRLLPFLRVTLNATGGGRLPPEVMDHVADCLASGVLSREQMARLRAHATNRDESRRVAQALADGGTVEEWLFNGGFWWEMGYEAAKEELGYEETEWPPIGDLEAVLRFLAFQPVASPWLHGKGDVVEQTMRQFETEE
jgi:hypothetical protein